MGWLSCTAACVFLLTISSQADAGVRIAYPTASQMYALLDSDVQVTFGSVPAKVPIAASYPLDQAALAHKRMAQGHVLGKLVLRMRGR